LPTAFVHRRRRGNAAGRAAQIVRRDLLQQFRQTDPGTAAWRARQTGKIAAALSMKQTWLMTPKRDSRDVLYGKIGPAISTLLSGAWDGLEIAQADEGDADAATAKRAFGAMAMGLARTALIAVLPVALFLLAEWLGLLADINASARSWAKIGLFVWAVLTVMFRLDPQFKDKIAVLNETATC